MRIAGVVLAAGASTRMGTNKMLLEHNGQALVAGAVVRAGLAGLSPVVVVVGHENDRVRAVLQGLDCTFAYNPAFTGPTSGSLHRGLEMLPADVDGVVVMLGDMVHVTSDMLRALVAEADASNAPLVVSRYGEVTAPPILFRRSLFGELLNWHGEGCGKAVVQRHLSEARALSWPESALADVDTPEDFALLESVQG